MNVPYPADENMLDFPLNSEPKEPVYSNDVDAKYTYTANSYKRNGIRRCGMLLLKHIQSIWWVSILRTLSLIFLLLMVQKMFSFVFICIIESYNISGTVWNIDSF